MIELQLRVDDVRVILFNLLLISGGRDRVEVQGNMSHTGNIDIIRRFIICSMENDTKSIKLHTTLFNACKRHSHFLLVCGVQAVIK